MLLLVSWFLLAFVLVLQQSCLGDFVTLSIIGEYPFKEAWIGGVSARCLRLDVVSSVPGSQ